MKVFLTGGTGFVGLALAAEFAREGHEVTASANGPPPVWARAALPEVKFREVDVRDRAALADTLAAERPDLLVHGAALTPDEERERAGGTAAIFEINVAGTANAMEAAARTGIRRVLVLSSGSAYGRTLAEVDTLEETLDCRPTALYAISKFAAEKVALRLGELLGISTVTPRLSAVWGPWEYRTSQRQTLSPGYQILEAVMAGRNPVVGDDARLPLLFSEDAATMLVRLALGDCEGPVNVGSMDMVRLRDLAAAAMNEAEARRRTVGDSMSEIRLFTPGRPPMSLERLRSAIGDWPRTGLDVAVRRSFDWYDSLKGDRPY